MYKSKYRFIREKKKAIRKHFSFGNCGMEIYGFGDKYLHHSKWSMDALVREFEGEEWAFSPLIVFSGAHYQLKEKLNPHSFARWLRRQGERVDSHRRWANNHGSKIKAYFWAPSEKFKKKYIEAVKKWQEKNNINVERSENTGSSPW